MMDISVLERDEQLAALETAWDDLVAASAEDNPFRRWLWNWTWWKHYGQGRRLAILAARDNGVLVGLAPLYLHTEPLRPAGRELRLLGSTDVCSEYLGLIARRGTETEVVPALLTFLVDQWHQAWDMLRWTDLPADGVDVRPIEVFLQQRDLPFIQRPGCTNLRVHLPATWEEYLTQLSSKRRTKLRRVVREFEDLAEVEYIDPRTAEEFARTWDEMRELHNAHWQSEGQRGLFNLPQFNAFHSELSRAYFDRQMLVLSSLRVRGEAVASCYGIRLNETVYEYQRGHRPSWIASRPGHALQFHLFRHAIEQGVRCWDYLRGDYPHKRDWATDERSTRTLVIPARRTLAVKWLYLEQAVRRARTRLGMWRRRLALP